MLFRRDIIGNVFGITWIGIVSSLECSLVGIAAPSAMSVYLEMQFNGQKLASGTGFISHSLRGPVLVTNRHNFTGRHQDDGTVLSPTAGTPNEVKIYHHRRGLLGKWVPKLESLYHDPDFNYKRWYEHPVLGPKADIVALPLRDFFDVDLYPYDLMNLGPKILIGPSDIVSVVGFPFGLSAGGYFPLWATGFTASEPEVDYKNLPILLIDCRSRPGQSGSPVIAYRSGAVTTYTDEGPELSAGPCTRLIGIYSGRIHPESDIGIVWKARAIRELIQSV